MVQTPFINLLCQDRDKFIRLFHQLLQRAVSAETLLSVGIDLGTTTTQLVFSRLTVRNAGSAFSVPNYTVAAREVLRRSAVHFTPLRSERELDAGAIARIVDAEYAAAGIDRRAVQTGAVIITGETARRENARAVLEALSGYAGDFVVATAGPALESALAGRGAGAADYSQAHACTVVNLDIGGGTPNIARFTNGALTDTACLNVGGRLVKLEPDGRVTYVSPVLRPFVPYAPGDRLTPQDLAPAVSLLTEILEEALGFRPVHQDHVVAADRIKMKDCLGTGQEYLHRIRQFHVRLDIDSHAFGLLAPELS